MTVRRSAVAYLDGKHGSHPDDDSSPTFQVVFRNSGRFTLDTTWTYRASNFTPSVFVQSLLQYNDRTDRWSTNLRFHWLETAGTGLFLVYNDTESLNGMGPVNRTFIVKYARQFDLLN